MRVLAPYVDQVDDEIWRPTDDERAYDTQRHLDCADLGTRECSRVQ